MPLPRRCVFAGQRNNYCYAIYAMLINYASGDGRQIIILSQSHAILGRSRTIRLYMRRALVLLCLFVFIALPQAFASMAYASPLPLPHADATFSTTELSDGYQLADPLCGADDVEECDNDPITLYPSLRQAAPFCAIIWQAGPGALSEADVWPATRPPRVRG